MPVSKKEKADFIAALKKFIVSQGYTLDAFGHYVKFGTRQRTSRDGEILAERFGYRYVFNAISLRFECKNYYSDGSSSWIRLRSGNYTGLSIAQTEDGSTKIFGLKH